MDDIVVTMKLATLSLQDGLKAFEDPSYMELEERMTKLRSPCARSYHFIFKMMMQCILQLMLDNILFIYSSENNRYSW